MARVALGACKIASVVVFCFGVDLVKLPSWVADNIDFHIDWIGWDPYLVMGIIYGWCSYRKLSFQLVTVGSFMTLPRNIHIASCLEKTYKVQKILRLIFCDMQGITEIMKILFHKNLEPYGMRNFTGDNWCQSISALVKYQKAIITIVTSFN